MNDVKEQKFRCIWEPEPGVEVYAPVEEPEEVEE